MKYLNKKHVLSQIYIVIMTIDETIREGKTLMQHY